MWCMYDHLNEIKATADFIDKPALVIDDSYYKLNIMVTSLFSKLLL